MQMETVRQNYSLPGLTLQPQTSVLREGSLDKAGTTLGDLLVFAVPALRFLELEVIGRLFASDLILLGVIPFLLLSKGRRLAAPLPRMFLALGLGWLLEQMATDLICDTPFEDYARGWAKIAFFLSNFTALYLLLHDNRRRIVLYATGMVVGGVLSFYLSPSVYAGAEPWKFGVGVPITWVFILLTMYNQNYRPSSLSVVTLGSAFFLNFVVGSLLLFLIIFYPNSLGGVSLLKFGLVGLAVLLFAVVLQHESVYRPRRLPVAIIGFATFLNLYLGSRSLAGVCLLTSVCVFLQQKKGHVKEYSAKLSSCNLALLGIIYVGMGFAFLKGYEYTASKGFLGEEAQQKYEQQSAGELGVVGGGRGTIIVALRAIVDSPILGHGSWARDWRYADMLIELRRDYGYSGGRGFFDTDLIPTHSHLFGSWVEAGILGGVVWLWTLLLAVRALLVLYRIDEPLVPLVAFVGFMLIWDVLFSPFGAEGRFIIPYYIILLMFVADVMSRKRNRVCK